MSELELPTPLADRVRWLAGRKVSEVAEHYGLAVPASQKEGKGFIGQLVERALGCTAGFSPSPDFPEYGIELKTIPLGETGHPSESTFVCTHNPKLDESGWETSRVKHKLARVLWMPHRSVGDAPFERIFGAAIFWTPSHDQESVLRSDWEELMSELVRRRGSFMSARHGQALQIRPKGQSAAARRIVFDESDGPLEAHRAAFYLRTSFTAQVVAR